VIEDVHHVRPADLSGCLGLALEANANLLVRGFLGINELDGALAIERLVVRKPHRAHATGPELSKQAVAFRDDAASSGCLHEVRSQVFGLAKVIPSMRVRSRSPDARKIQ